MYKGHAESWSWKQLIWAVTTIIIIPNAMMWVYASGYALERPYINIDYAIVMLLFIMGQRFFGVVALTIAFFFDVLALAGQVFPILRVSDVLYMSRFITAAPASYQLSLVSLILTCLLLVTTFLFWNRRKNKLVFIACINILIFCYGVSAIFFNDETTVVWSSGERSVISSQVVFGFDSRNTGFVGGLSVDGKIFGEVAPAAATQSWFENSSDVDEKVLLIINESWGVTNDTIQAAVMAPLLNVDQRTAEWQEGTLSFNGITVEAEIRELCRADLLHFNFEGHDKALDDCMPNQLKRAGYETFSFHGAAGLMYDRVKWYPKIGFDHTVFFENRSWPKRCYSFPGACDTDIAQELANIYSYSGPVFGYWLTLNTHHQYDLRDLSSDNLKCDHVGVRPSTETCRNLKLQNQFFASLADVVSEPQMSGVHVLVVSDHEPRISNQDEMDDYFRKGVIPWLSFTIK